MHPTGSCQVPNWSYWNRSNHQRHSNWIYILSKFILYIHAFLWRSELWCRLLKTLKMNSRERALDESRTQRARTEYQITVTERIDTDIYQNHDDHLARPPNPSRKKSVWSVVFMLRIYILIVKLRILNGTTTTLWAAAAEQSKSILFWVSRPSIEDQLARLM